MISVQEAIETLKSNIPELKIELRKTYDSIGYYLAQDVYSNLDTPHFDNSAMDGYAISEEDAQELLQNHTEKIFEVIGSSLAGIPFESPVSKGFCVQINTGAKIPHKTGGIIPLEEIEYANAEKTKIKVRNIKRMFQNIRKKGEEINKGQILFYKNSLLNSNMISLLLHCGVTEIFVYKKPKVLLITTGNELISYKENIAEEDCLQGKIIDINSYNIESYLKMYYIEYYPKFQTQDKEKEIYHTIKKYLNEVDLIIITGGVSIGPYDFVKRDVEELGFRTIFWKIKQKPGKPFYFAKNEDKLLFGLPGNPVSTYISFQHYILPLLKYYDSRQWIQHTVKLKSLENIENSSDKDAFFTIVRKNEFYFSLYNKQGSHMFSSIALADGYILVKANESIKVGEEVNCYLWT